jgi:hypothetical protein
MSLCTNPALDTTPNPVLLPNAVREPDTCHCCSIGLEDDDLTVECVVCGAAYHAGAADDCLMTCGCS